MSEKFIYSFNEGSKEMRDLLGGKGADLAEMTRIGLPVPFGFTITTETCNRYYKDNMIISDDIVEAIYEKIDELENVTGKTFTSSENPLLVSVRAGSVTPSPGVMDTILNLGLNDESVEVLATLSGNRKFALDSYIRFIRVFGYTVLGIPKDKFEVDREDDDLDEIIVKYKTIVKEYTGKEFPQDPKEQLIEAVRTAFESWNCEEAVSYRKANHITEEIGTAVNVQSMVFGNMGDDSGTGIVFTRNPIDGTKKISGKFLVNAQGEDLVSGTNLPLEIDKLDDVFPNNNINFVKIAELLEKHYKDVQEIELTIERGKLYVLQTRSCDRSAEAALKFAVDMVEEGLISRETAVSRIEAKQIEELLEPMLKDLRLSDELTKLLDWADEFRSLKIRANADNPEDARLAVLLGAEGIGLCRTEGAFCGKEIFRIMGERPVTVRLIDPPLHKYLPQTEDEIRQSAITQTEAIIGAALEVSKEEDIEILPEIMVPLVATSAEFKIVKESVVKTADRLISESGIDMEYLVGTMIEIPRAALTADELAKEAEFFSFGTNDLTQFSYGFANKDSVEIIDEYIRNGILEDNPFKTLDINGVGQLIKTATTLGRQSRPKLKLGICGDHSGDPKTIEFCNEIGLNYITCVPSKVPVARLVAAKAAIKSNKTQ